MRLDRRMVELGLAPSRTRAADLIAGGSVEIDGARARKPSQTVSADAVIRLTGEPEPWVSRAALKLLHALETFDLTPRGVALDVGASTGGFTQVLLARGAAKVFAVDVGHGQLAPALAADPRVVSLEGLNARDLTADHVEPPDWVVSDVYFISLEKALPPALMLARPDAVLVALIKPQFEAGPAHVGRGGIVRDPEVHDAVQARIHEFLHASGWQVTGACPSPIEGRDGNREFLVAARKG